MCDITRKSLLYKTGVEYGDYTINHIEGCFHGCKYPCYAMLLSKRFGRIKTYNDWLKPKIVVNALDLLDKELPKLADKISSVHLCFMSDPFMMNHPEITELSLNIIRKINDFGIRITSLTKGRYPSDLIDYGINKANEYGISLVACNANFVRLYEPNAQKWHLRIKNLEGIHRQGVKTWVSIEPFPTPNIFRQNLDELLNRVAFTKKIVFGRLNYNKNTSLYAEHRQYYNECSIQVAEFCNKYGIDFHIKEGTITLPRVLLKQKLHLKKYA
ncbi:MAG: radical SAM protein [Candidatus Zixiibacteriota bacterium]|nr:MAG: radical SAM protein [candidate division Zixibacteria bacterium]